jgi:hypothetical protein
MVEKPMKIGLVLVIAALFSGCAQRNQTELVPTRPFRQSPALVQNSGMQSPIARMGEYVASLPIDEEAKRLGKKVHAKRDARILRSPRDSAPEYYRLREGAPMFVSPTQDPKWLQVRMSRGRSGFVRTDETSAALSLALAQGAIADKNRLTPKPRNDAEPDVGNGNSGSPNERDLALSEAIERLDTAFQLADEGFDRLRAEANAFQGSPDGWPSARDSTLQELNVFQSEFHEVSSAVQTLTSLSSKLTANERSAYQSIVIHQGEVTDSIQTIRQTLNQMTEGSDWTGLVSTLSDNMSSLAGAMDGLRSNLARL